MDCQDWRQVRGKAPSKEYRNGKFVAVGFEANQTECGASVQLTERTGQGKAAGLGLGSHPFRYLMQPAGVREDALEFARGISSQCRQGILENREVNAIFEVMSGQSRNGNPPHSVRRLALRPKSFQDGVAAVRAIWECKQAVGFKIPRSLDRFGKLLRRARVCR